MEHIVYNTNKVICDLCDADYTNSDEQGGFVFLSTGVCPKCAPRFLKEVKKYNEEKFIAALPKEGESYKDFIYRFRKEFL